MACYGCGQNRENVYSGDCARPVIDWCSGCDTGVEAVFVPCCCEQPVPAYANGDPCGCNQNNVTPTR